MEEASLAFSVAGEEERESEEEEEEEERQRKEEIHQLLSDQLQDHLLDDSVSTATTDGPDSTLLGEEVGVALDHVISPNQSCDYESAQQPTVTGESQISDVFSGTAQAYSLLPPPPPPHRHHNPIIIMEEEEEEEKKEGRHREIGQLQVLYGARCRQMTELTQQLVQAREEGERKERVIRHEKTQLEMKLRQQKIEFEQQMKIVTQQLHETKMTLETLEMEREETCAMIHPTPEGVEEDAKRMIEISTEKEDLQFQLSCCQGQLEVLNQRALAAEVQLKGVSDKLVAVQREAEELRSAVTQLEEEKEREKENFATEKREALEKCRAVCLQLHESSTLRLREETLSEIEVLQLQHRSQLSAVQEELLGVREEYVLICDEKVKMETAHKTVVEEIEREWQERVSECIAAGEEKEKLAVENAREEWREAVVMETRQSVEKAIFSTRQQWQLRLEAEKEMVKKEEEREKERAVKAAVEAAYRQWNTSHEHDIQRAVEEAKKENISIDKVQSMLQVTISVIKRDVRKMLEDVMEAGREREKKAVADCRLVTAQEMRTHYLNCLHTMVNTPPPPPPQTDKGTVVGSKKKVGLQQPCPRSQRQKMNK